MARRRAHAPLCEETPAGPFDPATDPLELRSLFEDDELHAASPRRRKAASEGPRHPLDAELERPFRPAQAERRARPLARRRARARRPPTVCMRLRKPWRRLRTILLGWYVRFTDLSPLISKSRLGSARDARAAWSPRFHRQKADATGSPNRRLHSRKLIVSARVIVRRSGEVNDARDAF